MTVAQIILEQLGGNRFIAMTGAKNFVAGEQALNFRIGKNASKANMVRISLASNDTYAIEYFNQRGIECKSVGFVNGLFAENLCTAFEFFTGLRTSL